jgi:hypothetical protein
MLLNINKKVCDHCSFDQSINKAQKKTKEENDQILEYLERDTELDGKKKLATKAMLRKVKLYIENTAFDDSRILKKRECSGLILTAKDTIIKRIKSKDGDGDMLATSFDDFSHIQELLDKYPTIKEIKQADLLQVD